MGGPLLFVFLLLNSILLSHGKKLDVEQDVMRITNNLDNTAEERTSKGIINKMDGTVEERWTVRRYCSAICGRLGLPPQKCLRMCHIQIMCRRQNAGCEDCFHRCLLNWTFKAFTMEPKT